MDKEGPFLRRGLGVVLQGGQILVTAELVANRTYVELEKAGSAEKSPAEIIVVDYDCNLALLRPADSTFLKDAKPLTLDTGASVGDRASILQLESNGLIADTPGVITTITVAGYPLDHLALLTYRISAPLQNREGSFTIPAIRDGRLLGLLMRYDSQPDGGRHCRAGDCPFSRRCETRKLSRLSSCWSGLRRYPRSAVSSLHRSPGGRRLHYRSSTWERRRKAGLAQGGCHPAVAGKPLDPDGNYEEPGIGRIPFSHITNTLSHVGDTVNFSILRDGKRETIPSPSPAFATNQASAMLTNLIVNRATWFSVA